MVKLFGKMYRPRTCYVDVIIWGFVVYLALHMPLIEMRTNDDEMQKYVTEQPAASTEKPEPEVPSLKDGRCFHMPRSQCPTNGTACKKIGQVSVFCCNVDSFRLKEGLTMTMNQNVTNLHVLNASIEELNVSTAQYRRLVSMALTDGNIGKIVGQFPKHSSIACLNISHNNLTSAKLEPSNQRPFAYLFNLTMLDASANNLTEFPLSLVQSNRKITVDFSGNDYLPCKHFQKAMEANNSFLVTFKNYEKTKCALDLQFNWFAEVQIVNIDHLKKQKELNASCALIQPPNMNCTCVLNRLELLGGEVTNLVEVDCSQRHLREMPTNLPANTVKLNVSYNNITSLQAVADDPTYEHLRQLIVDYNDIQSIVELEGTKFIDNFMLFSISHNKLKTIHTYVLSNKFDTTSLYTTFGIAENYIHCDCNTEKVLKPWLLENFKNIPDYKSLQCQDNMGPVVDLIEFQVCHTPRDWTDYIYYIIGLEALVLILLISKVSYDYWVFKTAGYLPWPANKMPRLPCDWLCE
ncbi:protein halfway isoform X2 [Pectinophora gossypiella]|uniref:protein halfway isoform X2 n=1 Tax=Pectinophora gossypiella TaxID=13191 RepID=UPI00214E8943|nr:protein halfway isoform X2 [Pectinophora gossypiella]